MRHRHFLYLLLILATTAGCVQSKGRWISKPSDKTIITPVYEASLKPLKYDNPFFVAFKLTLKNTGKDPFAIDWNQTTYISDGNKRGVFIFKGLSPEDIRDKTIPPDTVKPGGTLAKEIAPFRLLAGAPLKSRHKTDSKISAGMLDEGENGILLVIKQGTVYHKKHISTSIQFIKE